MSSLYDIPMFIHLLANFGFPIMISIYLLMRFEKRIERLEKILGDLAELIKFMSNR